MTRILVSGPNSRLRAALIEQAVARGADVVLFDWIEDGCGAPPVANLAVPQVTSRSLDPLNQDSWDILCEELLTSLGRLDHAICLAPHSHSENILDMSIDAWTRSMDFGIGATIQGLRSIELAITSQKPSAVAPSVVVIADMVDEISISGAGLASLVRSVANRWAALRPALRINLIGTPHENSNSLPVVEYLFSNDSSFTTGTYISMGMKY